jgi:hypothetical protein
MKYPKKGLAEYNKFYKRLLYHNSLEDVIIVYRGEVYSMRVIQDEVHYRTELGLKLIKRIKELGLR